MTNSLIRNSTLVAPEVLHCLAACVDLVAVGCRDLVYVWPQFGSDCPAPMIRLEGHQKKITALSFDAAGLRLCTASKDVIAVWDVPHVLQMWREWEDAHQEDDLDDPDAEDMFETGFDAQCTALLRFHSNFSVDPTYLCFGCEEDALLVVALDDTILIFSLETLSPTIQLDGHTGSVTQVLFPTHFPQTLVSVSLDRTFKVWDLVGQQLQYQSAILAAAGISCLAEDPVHPRMAVGFEDGTLRFFEMASKVWTEVYVLDVSRFVHRALQVRTPAPSDAPSPAEARPGVTVVHGVRPGRPPPTPPPRPSPAPAPSGDGRTYGVLGVHHLPRGQYGTAHDHGRLLVTTPWCFVTVNTDSYEPTYVADMASPDVEAPGDAPDAVCHVHCAPIPYGARIFVGSAFQPVLNVYEMVDREALVQGTRRPGDHGPCEGEGGVGGLPGATSLFAQRPLPPHLTMDYVPQAVKDQQQQAAQSRQRRISGSGTRKPSVGGRAPKDMPVTFHAKVKSSGYNAGPPVMTMFGRRPAPKKGSTAATTGPRRPTAGPSAPGYGLDHGPPVHPQPKNNLNALHNGPILSLAYANDGKTLASTSQDATVRVVRLPVSAHGDRGQFTLQAHRQAVNMCSFSLDRQMLLTASNDCTACLWLLEGTRKRDVPNLIWNTRDKDMPITTEVRAARFFYMDSFVVLAAGPAAYLFKYYVDRSVNDLNRHTNNSGYKVAQVVGSGAQHILALDCANSFYSNLLLYSTSSRALVVHDVASGTAVQTYADAHARPAVTVALPTHGGPGPPQDSLAYSTFLSGAPDGSVKLWDLRQPSAARTYASHTNRVGHVGAAYSPCLRYVACGSEDRCVYLYDLVSAAVLAKLHGHTDVVSDVAFNPLHPQLAACSFDTRVRFWAAVKQS